MPTILLARHGQGSFGGANYDVLSPLGREQAQILAGEVARRGVRIDRVIAGSLQRQRDTAAPVAAAAGLQLEIDPRWNEYDADDVLTHHSASAVRDSRPEGSDAPPVTSEEFQDAIEEGLAAWIAAGAASTAAERWPQFAGRVRAALEDAAASLGSGETVLVATSGGVIASVCTALLGLPDQALMTFNRVSINAGLTKVVAGRRGFTLVSYNDHAHLEGSDRALVTYR
ncbi:unannotated protein [freshwater metagenome]|uniref:Unannotated protein n=1 Tax=freshwater metagenome TaxID=449393 RepID=A0A6J7CP49_9ZZZZ|nr:histidine phosphatase family protein [Actinomycetota bacterium]